MSNTGNGRNIHDIEPGITHCLAKHQPSLRCDRCLHCLDITHIDKRGGDAKSWQCVGQQIVAAAIEGA